jgi:hypothetical protein
MRKISLGFALGLLIGAAVPVAAATIVGTSGYLTGWIVTNNGREVCYAPYVWTYSREIECN